MEDRRTVGFEEEFLLVDANGVPAPKADLVLDWLRANLDPDESERFKPELQKVQIESVSGVHTSMKALHAELSTARQRLGAAADRCELAVLPVGTAPACGAAADVTTHSRYERIHHRYGEMTRSYTACGAHVHVGIDDAEQAVAVVNHLRPWLPILVAIGANSPFHHGRDSGYSSWRIAEQARFPGAGLPPFSRSAADYRERIAVLRECGVLIDDHMSFWMARPSDAFPTVEVRAVDTAATVDDAVLQALLTRGLVHTAIRKLDAGIEGPALDDQVAAAAVWTAARYGLDGPAIDPIGQIQVPAVRMVEKLTAWIADELEEVGDTAEATRLLTAVHQHGTGAARQRIAAVSGLPGLVESFRLTGEFAPAGMSFEEGG
ncbi:carboxylate-amine ligase [Nocardia sp. NBC_01327]|uniref:carboxylate-amine ligase n=1 Tax=Nocardia sp. NBC_01327 TaxID=2903593 RepID=UPI002E12FF46|nr:glutamate--cysteine ligase [Nocardia sp. NBC_01327]